MSKTSIFQTANDLERINLLKENADSIETKIIPRPLSQDEINEISSKLGERTLRQITLEEEAKEIKKNLTSINKEIRRNLKQLAQREIEETQEVYLFIDREERKMNTYGKDGNLIFSRPLTPNEQQKFITEEIRKEGTNN